MVLRVAVNWQEITVISLFEKKTRQNHPQIQNTFVWKYPNSFFFLFKISISHTNILQHLFVLHTLFFRSDIKCYSLNIWTKSFVQNHGIPSRITFHDTMQAITLFSSLKTTFQPATAFGIYRTSAELAGCWDCVSSVCSVHVVLTLYFCTSAWGFGNLSHPPQPQTVNPPKSLPLWSPS